MHDAAQSKACCAQEACLQGAFLKSTGWQRQVARGKAKAAKATEERARTEILFSLWFQRAVLARKMKEPFLKMFVNALTKAGLEESRKSLWQGDPDPSEMAWDLLGRRDLNQKPYRPTKKILYSTIYSILYHLTDH